MSLSYFFIHLADVFFYPKRLIQMRIKEAHHEHQINILYNNIISKGSCDTKDF